MNDEEVKPCYLKTTEGPRCLDFRMDDPQRFDGYSERDMLYTMDQQVKLEPIHRVQTKVQLKKNKT